MDEAHGWAIADSATTEPPSGTGPPSIDIGPTELILRTTDGGRHWKSTDVGVEAVQGVSTVDYLSSLYFADARTGWAVGGILDGPGVILCSRDGGATWQHQLRTNHALHAVCFVDNQHGLAVGESGTVLATSDGGATWHQAKVPTSMSLVAVSFADAQHGWIAARATGDGQTTGTVCATTDGRASWHQQTLPSSMNPTTVSFADAAHGWVAGGQADSDRALALAETSDGGATWVAVPSPTDGVVGAIQMTDVGHAWAVSLGNNHAQVLRIGSR